jgi:NADPH2:quinone reductase
MRRWLVEGVGATGGMTLERDAEAAHGGLVVAVRRAGVGFPDLLMRRGEFQIRQPEPFTLGWEAAGEVVAVPEGSPFSPGDRVVTMSFGAFAEQVSADPGSTFRLPDDWSFDEGAAFPLNWFTALAAVRRGRIEKGEVVLVTGAGGGVGSATVQVAAALGAEVVALVSSDAKADLAREAGASTVLRSGSDWRTELKARHPRGVDVVVDQVGGDLFADGLRSLASEGRYVVVGFADGRIPSVQLNRLLYRNVAVCGATWSVLAEHSGGLAAAAAELFALAERTGIRPLVGTRYPFGDLPQALDDLAGRRGLGKLILEVTSDAAPSPS